MKRSVQACSLLASSRPCLIYIYIYKYMLFFCFSSFSFLKPAVHPSVFPLYPIETKPIVLTIHDNKDENDNSSLPCHMSGLGLVRANPLVLPSTTTSSSSSNKARKVLWSLGFVKWCSRFTSALVVSSFIEDLTGGKKERESSRGWQNPSLARSWRDIVFCGRGLAWFGLD